MYNKIISTKRNLEKLFEEVALKKYDDPSLIS